MNKWICVIIILFSCAAYAEKVYMHRDAQGNVSFSDQEIDGAKQLDISPIPTMNMKPARAATGRLKAQNQRSKLSTESIQGYKSLVISSPTQDTVLRNIQSLAVSVSLFPPLNTQLGHQLIILSNGTPLPKNTSTINQLTRGTYTIQAKVVDKQGASLINATPVRFHVKQHSKLH
ncbi:MAG: DUF4124 domain-containing protein [Gammaproteobacteria bacterium]|nr:DUF4124 domain-containing protein [Gammaproteobacteria bacterium]